MKDVLKKTIFNAILRISKLLASSNNCKSALILAPSWEGNIGDQAVIQAISSQLKKRGFTTTLIHFNDEREWGYLNDIDHWYSISPYFKGDRWRAHFNLILKFRNYSHFYTLGTDMMDGCYADWLTNGIINITNHAAHSGLKTTIVGFSINKWQREEIIKNLGSIHPDVKFCLRDDVSRQRFTNLLEHRSSILTADMAFMLEPTLQSDQIINANRWILNKKGSGNIILGLNVNKQLFNDENKTHQFIDVFSEAIKSIYEKYVQISFVLIPHDFRSSNSDIDLLKELKINLDTFCEKDLILISEEFLASDMMGLVENIDVVITARMHLSIACMGQAIPLGCLVYQGKFEGLFNHFKLSKNYMLDPKDAMDLETLTAFMDRIITERAFIRDKIIEEIDEVKRKALLNL